MKSKSTALLLRGAGVLALVGAMSLAAPARADTAGGATIHNVATLSYAGGGAPLKAAVNVAVQTVAALPTVALSTAGQTVPAYSEADYVFTFTSNSNGSDTLALSLGSVDSNTTAPGLSFLLNGTAVASITLAGSVTSQPSGAGVISIPAGSQSDFSVGDTVEIAGNLYTVAAVSIGTPAATDVVTGVTTAEVPSSLTLTPVGAAPAITAGSVPAGTQVGEQVTLLQRVTASAPTTNAPATHTVSFTATTTATSLAGGAEVYSSGGVADTVTTVVPATVSLAKLVRNVDRASGNPVLGGVACSGSTFFTAGVTTKTGDTLEFCLIASVAVGASMPLSGAVITDDLPPYTSYVLNSTTLNTAPVADEGGTTPLATANGGMAVNSPGEPAGEIALGDSATVTFRATVQ